MLMSGNSLRTTPGINIQNRDRKGNATHLLSATQPRKNTRCSYCHDVLRTRTPYTAHARTSSVDHPHIITCMFADKMHWVHVREQRAGTQQCHVQFHCTQRHGLGNLKVVITAPSTILIWLLMPSNSIIALQPARLLHASCALCCFTPHNLSCLRSTTHSE